MRVRLSLNSCLHLSYFLLGFSLLVSLGVVQKANAQTATWTPLPTQEEIHPTFGAIQTNTPSILTATAVATLDRSGCPDAPVSPDGVDPDWAAYCARCMAGTATPVATIQSFVIGTVPPIGTHVEQTRLPTIEPMYLPATVPPLTSTPAPTGTEPPPMLYEWKHDFYDGFTGWSINAPAGSMPYPFGQYTSNGWEALENPAGNWFIAGTWSGSIPDVAYIKIVYHEGNMGNTFAFEINGVTQSSGCGWHNCAIPDDDGYLYRWFGDDVGFDPEVTITSMATYFDSPDYFGIREIIFYSRVPEGDETPTPTATPPPTLLPSLNCSVALEYDTSTPVAGVEFDETDLGENCYTIIPEISVTATDPDISFDGLELCIEWKALPVVSLLGVTFYIDLLTIIPAAFVVKKLLSM